jgi:hypothetical protein
MGVYLQDNCPTPVTVQDVSSPGVLASVWVGSTGPLLVSKVLWFGVNDTVLRAAVVIENRGTQPVYTVDYIRTINPDQVSVLRVVCCVFSSVRVPECGPLRWPWASRVSVSMVWVGVGWLAGWRRSTPGCGSS